MHQFLASLPPTWFWKPVTTADWQDVDAADEPSDKKKPEPKFGDTVKKRTRGSGGSPGGHYKSEQNSVERAIEYLKDNAGVETHCGIGVRPAGMCTTDAELPANSSTIAEEMVHEVGSWALIYHGKKWREGRIVAQNTTGRNRRT